MFIDEARIFVKAGDGGDGCNSLYRDRVNRIGTPDGGPGGAGGTGAVGGYGGYDGSIGGYGGTGAVGGAGGFANLAVLVPVPAADEQQNPGSGVQAVYAELPPGGGNHDCQTPQTSQ